MAARVLSLPDRISNALRKEARKAAILTFLVSLLVVLWIRMAMKGKEGPQQANAAGPAARVDGSNGANKSKVPGRSPEAAASVKSWMGSPLKPINRNLFAVNFDHFPQENRGAADNAPGVGGFWGEMAKSVSAKADVRKERQTLVENLQLQASQLRLQTTLMGAKPKAVVNGAMVGEGDVVACGPVESRVTFRVLKIEARRIIVEREGIKLEIPMKKATMPEF